MKVASSRADLSSALADLGGARRSVGLVPTMGALHRGHDSLIAAARADATSVVVSIFVNPLQFGVGEDFAAYPRTLDDDLDRCADLGVDVVFAPTSDTIYPEGPPPVTVDPGPLGRELEGASRPGHFAGVLTVVVKLFGLVGPQFAVFGSKDYQQLVLVRRCVRDLCLPVRVVAVETVRATDGLALSSRNRYLTEAERTAALALSRALRRGREEGPHGAAAVLSTARDELAEVSDVWVDYLQLRDEDLGPAPVEGRARLLVAARVGSTRLIDNVAVWLGPDRGVRPTSVGGSGRGTDALA